MKLLPQSPDLRYLVRVLPVRVKYDPLPGEATYAFLPEPVQDICHSFFEGGGFQSVHGHLFLSFLLSKMLRCFLVRWF